MRSEVVDKTAFPSSAWLIGLSCPTPHTRLSASRKETAPPSWRGSSFQSSFRIRDVRRLPQYRLADAQSACRKAACDTTCSSFWPPSLFLIRTILKPLQ
jgi:hypothetical protein